MAVNFCSNCGAKLRAGAKFCGSCGQKIQQEPPPPSKSVAELYAEKKAAAKAKPAVPVKLEKTLPASQEKPKSVAEIFAETKRAAQAQVAREKLIETYTAAKEKAAPTAPPPQPVTPPQPTYTPLNSMPSYRKDATIKEKFFSTEGRLNRHTYFTRTLLVNIVLSVAFILIAGICSTPWGDITPAGEALIGIVGIAGLIPKYHLDVRRIKDIGKFFKTELTTSGEVQTVAAAYAVIQLIFMYLMKDVDLFDGRSSLPGLARSISGFLTVFWLWMQFKSGMVGANKFGADPLEDERRFNQ